MKSTNWLTAKPTLAVNIAKELGKKSVIMSISKPYDITELWQCGRHCGSIRQ